MIAILLAFTLSQADDPFKTKIDFRCMVTGKGQHKTGERGVIRRRFPANTRKECEEFLQTYCERLMKDEITFEIKGFFRPGKKLAGIRINYTFSPTCIVTSRQQ